MISISVGPPKLQQATLDQPLDHLSACHRRIEQRLDTLERAIPVLWERRDEALQAIRNAFAFLDENGALHTEDEEVSLFPRLQPKLQPQQAAFVASLEADHRVVHNLYAQLRAVVASVETTTTRNAALAAEYAALVERFCTLYRRHIQQEDSQLIDIGRAILTDEELAQIAAEMKARRAATTIE